MYSFACPAGTVSCKRDGFHIVTSSADGRTVPPAAAAAAGVGCASGCLQVPLPLREAVYDIVAANRYSWFGKTGQCQVGARASKDVPL